MSKLTTVAVIIRGEFAQHRFGYGFALGVAVHWVLHGMGWLLAFLVSFCKVLLHSFL